MSPPSPSWALRGKANFRSREAAPVDPAVARREWLALARAIEAEGGTVVALEAPDPAWTGMPYAAECGHVVVRGGVPTFLLPRMKAEHRKREREAWGPFAASLGLAVVDPLEACPGEVWEAQGDVARYQGVTLLFHGGRTTRAGHDAARRFFEGEVLELEVHEPAFHGNMALLPLEAPEGGALLYCPAVFSDASRAALEARFGAALFAVTEDEIRSYATNGLPVGGALLAPSLAPERVLAFVASRGVRVVRLEMGELCGKAGGASRCLVSHASLPDGALRVPDGARLAAVAARMEATP